MLGGPRPAASPRPRANVQPRGVLRDEPVRAHQVRPQTAPRRQPERSPIIPLGLDARSARPPPRLAVREGTRCQTSIGAASPRSAGDRDSNFEGACRATISAQTRAQLSVVEWQRYGDLTDEFEQMFSAEALASPGTIIACGEYAAELYAEMLRYLVTPN